MTTTNESDHVLVLHSPDGAEWAKFLSARLDSPSYNINSTLIDITNIPESSSSLLSSSSSPTSSSSTQNTTSCEDHQHDAVYTNEKELLDEGSVYTNDITVKSNNNNNNNNNNNDTGVNFNQDGINPSHSKKQNRLSQSIDQSRVCAIFITPDITAGEQAFCIDLDWLNPRRTVFLLLGVELAEVMQYFGPQYDLVSKCRCCFIYGTEDTIRGGIVSIIEAYEEDELDGVEDEVEEFDVYKVPNQPVQRNTIDKVFPRMVTETEREVYILLASIPEDDVQIDLVDHAITLPLKSVCERLYSFVLPPNIYGEVNFQLECQGRRFGDDSVHSYSKLDLIQNILMSELNPHALIASSLGLDKDDIGWLDTHLAFKLQELAPVMTFKALCPIEEALKNTSDEQSKKMWPTLLHFAAELNLRLLCSELLRYPGMVAAACTENRAGEYPCDIAKRKGFLLLENDLMEFMKRVRREVDPDYMTSRECDLSSSGGSSTANLSDFSVSNGNTDDANTYLHMTSETHRLRKPFLDRILQKPRAMSESSLLPEKSLSRKKWDGKRSLSGHSPSRPPFRTHSDRSDVSRNKSGHSQRPLPKRPDSPTEDDKQETYSNPEESSQSAQGSPTSQKALKRLGATEEDVTSRYSTVDPKIAETAYLYSASCPPGTLRARLFDDVDSDRLSISSNCDIPELTGLNDTSKDSKRGPLLDKVRGFFHKKKKVSKSRRGSEPNTKSLLKSSRNKSHSHSFDEERDSGSYSDEEKKQKVFVPSNKPMTRRISRRIEYAKRESYATDAPQLPAVDKRATFKSFIEKNF